MNDHPLVPPTLNSPKISSTRLSPPMSISSHSIPNLYKGIYFYIHDSLHPKVSQAVRLPSPSLSFSPLFCSLLSSLSSYPNSYSTTEQLNVHHHNQTIPPHHDSIRTKSLISLPLISTSQNSLSYNISIRKLRIITTTMGKGKVKE